MAALAQNNVIELPRRKLSFVELHSPSCNNTQQERHEVNTAIERVLTRRLRRMGSYRRTDNDTYLIHFDGLSDDDAQIVANLLTEEVRQNLLLSDRAAPYSAA